MGCCKSVELRASGEGEIDDDTSSVAANPIRTSAKDDALEAALDQEAKDDAFEAALEEVHASIDEYRLSDAFRSSNGNGTTGAGPASQAPPLGNTQTGPTSQAPPLGNTQTGPASQAPPLGNTQTGRASQAPAASSPPPSTSAPSDSEVDAALRSKFGGSFRRPSFDQGSPEVVAKRRAR